MLNERQQRAVQFLNERQQRAVQSVRLMADSRSGGKFYNIYINSAPGHHGLYTVDFEYGAIGATPRTGTKTKTPVEIYTARNIFANLQREKQYGDSHYGVIVEQQRRDVACPVPPVRRQVLPTSRPAPRTRIAGLEAGTALPPTPPVAPAPVQQAAPPAPPQSIAEIITSIRGARRIKIPKKS